MGLPGVIAYIIVGVLVIATALASFLWVAPVLEGISGLPPDDPKPEAASLATLVTDTTEFLITLGLALLTGIGFFLVSNSVRTSTMSASWRHTIAAGAIAAALSLLIGFVVMETIIHAAADALIRQHIRVLFRLQILQIISLSVGFGLVGLAIIKHGLVAEDK